MGERPPVKRKAAGSIPVGGAMERSPSLAYGAALLMRLGIASLTGSNPVLSAKSPWPSRLRHLPDKEAIGGSIPSGDTQ